MIDTRLSHFWERWRTEYVTSLRENQRVSRKKHSAKIEVNDIVIIYEEKQQRHLWKIGKINNVQYTNLIIFHIIFILLLSIIVVCIPTLTM